MRPDDRELDEEIRAHLAISVRERIEAGEDPEAARLAALREFGYVPAIRESMRQVWYSRWIDAAAALGRDMRIALRSLRRAKGLGPKTFEQVAPSRRARNFLIQARSIFRWPASWSTPCPR